LKTQSQVKKQCFEGRLHYGERRIKMEEDKTSLNKEGQQSIESQQQLYECLSNKFHKRNL